MHPNIKHKNTLKLLQQRNFSHIVVVFLMLVNAVLVVRLWCANERVIIVPSLSDPSKKYQITGSEIDDSYFRDWSANLLGDLYTANPKTVLQKNKNFLEWSLSSTGLSHDLAKSAKTIQKDKISTAFYPEVFKISRQEKKIFVTGKFLTFFGRSKNPVTTTKTFVLGWQVMYNGAIAIKSLKELKK